MVLFDGLGGIRRGWGQVAATFAKHSLVIALDMRGHGKE
jgi:pimeloyl-ACP methyl ester carboxylesterase